MWKGKIRPAKDLDAITRSGHSLNMELMKVVHQRDGKAVQWVEEAGAATLPSSPEEIQGSIALERSTGVQVQVRAPTFPHISCAILHLQFRISVSFGFLICVSWL